METIDAALLKKLIDPNAKVFAHNFKGTEKFYAATPLGNTGWILIKTLNVATVLAPVKNLQTSMLSIAIIAILISIAAGYILAGSFSGPMIKLSKVAERIASGDLAFEIEKNSSKDEIGKLHKSLVTMKASLLAFIKDVADDSQSLSSSSKELQASSAQSAGAAENTAASISDMAEGIRKQLTEISLVNDNINEINETTTEVKTEVERAVHSALDVKAVARDGERAVQNAISQMQQIEAATDNSNEITANLAGRSAEIGKIVEMIVAIAGQTNLLALNAAIEAARAGEAGRGFAVVADEVRKLAEQSQDAAKQISEIVVGIQNDSERSCSEAEKAKKEVQKGSLTVNEIGKGFQQISLRVDDLVNETDKVIDKITMLVGTTTKVNSSMGKLQKDAEINSLNAETISAATEEQSAAAEEITAAATELSHMALILQDQVGKFKV